MVRNNMRFESVARGVHRHCQNAWGLEMIGQSCGVPAGVVRWLIPMSLSSCMKMLFRILWCSGLYSTHTNTDKRLGHVVLSCFLPCIPTLSFEDLPQQSGVGLLVVFGVTHGRPGSA
jgi:hypothetical protein